MWLHPQLCQSTEPLQWDCLWIFVLQSRWPINYLLTYLLYITRNADIHVYRQVWATHDYSSAAPAGYLYFPLDPLDPHTPRPSTHDPRPSTPQLTKCTIKQLGQNTCTLHLQQQTFIRIFLSVQPAYNPAHIKIFFRWWAITIFVKSEIFPHSRSSCFSREIKQTTNFFRCHRALSISWPISGKHGDWFLRLPLRYPVTEKAVNQSGNDVTLCTVIPRKKPAFSLRHWGIPRPTHSELLGCYRHA